MSEACESDPVVFADEQPRDEPELQEGWNVLVVDDDPEVHRLTHLVLEGKSLVGKPVRLFSAWSAADAELILAQEDIACILLDVVMESEDAGLRLVERIRNSMGNLRVRIILRTGQPGQAPEGSVIERYEINDYREKTELTALKLTTSVTAALRSYRDIATIERSRLGMKMIVDASAGIHQLDSLKAYASGVLRLFVSLLFLRGRSVDEEASGLAVVNEGAERRILAGLGAYAGFEDRLVDAGFDPGLRETIAKAIECSQSVYSGDRFALKIEDGRGKSIILYVERAPQALALERELIDISAASTGPAFANIMMYAELGALLRDRSALLREVHHRVKNNLQIISSLIDIASEGTRKKPLGILLDVRDRIQSIAVVHDRIYESEGFEFIDFAEAARYIFETVEANEAIGTAVEFTSSFEPTTLSLTQALPCALLFRELVANAYRFALSSPGAERMAVRIGPSADGRCMEVSIRAGSREGGGASSGEGEIDYSLVTVLVEQLKAVMNRRDEDGMAIDIAIPRLP